MQSIKTGLSVFSIIYKARMSDIIEKINELHRSIDQRNITDTSEYAYPPAEKPINAYPDAVSILNEEPIYTFSLKEVQAVPRYLLEISQRGHDEYIDHSIYKRWTGAVLARISSSVDNWPLSKEFASGFLSLLQFTRSWARDTDRLSRDDPVHNAIQANGTWMTSVVAPTLLEGILTRHPKVNAQMSKKEIKIKPGLDLLQEDAYSKTTQKTLKLVNNISDSERNLLSIEANVESESIHWGEERNKSKMLFKFLQDARNENIHADQYTVSFASIYVILTCVVFWDIVSEYVDYEEVRKDTIFFIENNDRNGKYDLPQNFGFHIN